MDERLTALPAPDVVAWMDALVHSWCGFPRHLCPCDPQPLPEPKRSAAVLRLQRGRRAESAAEPPGTDLRPDTHGPADDASPAALGPMTPLFPGYYKTGGAA